MLTLSNIKRFATRLTVLASTASILAHNSVYEILRPKASSCRNKLLEDQFAINGMSIPGFHDCKKN